MAVAVVAVAVEAVVVAFVAVIVAFVVGSDEFPVLVMVLK